jgi:hypothetical protein
LYVWTYLIWHNFLLFSREIFEEVFVLPTLLSNKKNSSEYHNSYNKGPNLAFFSFTKNPSNSLLTIKFPKNISHLHIIETCLEQQRPFFGHHRALGINP